MALDLIGKIDVVLFLSDTDDLRYGMPQKEISRQLTNKGINIPERLMDEILVKLVEDKYFRCKRGNTEWGGVQYQNEENYLLTFAGELFRLNGGYIQTRINAAQTEKRIKANEKLLIRGTWFAGIAAVMLLLWQVFLYFYPVHRDFPYWIWQSVQK